MRRKFLALTISLIASSAWCQGAKDPLHQIAQSVGVISGVWFAVGTYLVVAAPCGRCVGECCFSVAY